MLVVPAVITHVSETSYHVALTPKATTACSQCANKQGCKQFSIAPILFNKKPITLQKAVTATDLKSGDELILKLPDWILSLSIGLILGLPMLAFLASLLLLPVHEVTAFFSGIALAVFASCIGMTLFSLSFRNNIKVEVVGSSSCAINDLKHS